MTELDRAVELLRAGELVAIPTETVYGLGADASNPIAVGKIFAAKGRPADHPLIVHLPGANHIDAWATNVPAAARRLAEVFWPGPLTLILRRQPHVPDVVTGGQDTVGLRVPDHPLTLDLLRRFDGGIAAPSANRFGRISPTCAAHVRDELGDAVALVLDGGPCAVGIESTIVDFSQEQPRILRPGKLTVDQLNAVAGVRIAPFGERANVAVPRVSGALEAHYAPRTPLRRVATSDLNAPLPPGQRAGVIARHAAPAAAVDGIVWRQLPASASGFAHELYAEMRALDQLGLSEIRIETLPLDAIWEAVNDRIGRAVTGSGSGT
jgi:L-threonylcarbamoyladenylate synthase